MSYKQTSQFMNNQNQSESVKISANQCYGEYWFWRPVYSTSNPHPGWSDYYDYESARVYAPSSKYNNYDIYADFPWYSSSLNDWPNITINSTTYHAFAPGVSSYADSIGEYDGNEYMITSQSAGIDCSGLIQRCTTYSSHSYSLTNLSDGRLYRGNPCYLSDKRNTTMIYNDYSSSIDANEIMPGDILIVNGVHVTIVRGVFFSEMVNTRSIENHLDLIETIEATPGNNNEWMVLKTRDWKDLNDVPSCPNFELRRLD